MGRPKGSRNKKKAVKVMKTPATKGAEEVKVEKSQVKVVEIPKAIEDDPRLPNKSNFRPDEVAYYFDVDRSTIYKWIDNGILTATKIAGTIRIPREAILACRFVNRLDPLA